MTYSLHPSTRLNLIRSYRTIKTLFLRTFSSGNCQKPENQPKPHIKPPINFYKRTLPSSLIPFSSKEGRKIFREALDEGGMECYFPLAEQFITQSDPSFCSISSLAMVLNALKFDPKKVWKGPWRWVSEETLQCESAANCGHSLDRIREEGLSFQDFESLARCHGVSIQSFQANPDHPTFCPVSIQHHPHVHDKTHSVLHHLHSQSNPHQNSLESSTITHRIQNSNHNHHLSEKTGRCCSKSHLSLQSPHLLAPSSSTIQSHSPSSVPLSSLALFRSWLSLTSNCPSGESFIIVNFSRTALGQTGEGHYSPLGGFHKDRDLVLVLDVARFKYPPFWVGVEELWNSMACEDRGNGGQSRGYFVISTQPTLNGSSS